MRLFPVFLVLLLWQSPARAQNPATALRHYSIGSELCGTIHCYVTTRDIDKQKPLLIYFDGSGDKPLFRFKVDSARKSSIMYSTITFNYDSMARYYHIAFISKPGVMFIDTTYVASLDSVVDYPTPQEYTRALSAEWRANAGSLAVNHLLRRLPVLRNKVIAMGYSEGAQVAPHVAAINKKVTHVVAFAGNGINQFYDFIIQERLRAVTGEITHAEAQNNIDTLLQTFRDIYAHPTATDKMWAGHSYKRWASFCTTDPLDYLLQLDIPIYLAKGTADENTQILSTDYVQLEFLRRCKTNLTLRPYPYCDHFFREIKDGKATDHIDEAMNDAFAWLQRQ